MQLERILHSQGFGSRKECRGLCRRGSVAVNGVAAEDPFVDVDTANLTLTVDDITLAYREKAHLMLNKPAGVECSRRPGHHPGVFVLLPYPLSARGVQPIGRLDYDTTGLLLLTDDGQFNHAISSPKRKRPKVYEVTTAAPVSEALVAALLAGVRLTDEPEPLAALACEQTGAYSLRLTLGEGKYHQVKRMLAAAGNHVTALHRTAIGGLTLPADLPPGAWRWLSAEDLAALSYGT